MRKRWSATRFSKRSDTPVLCARKSGWVRGSSRSSGARRRTGGVNCGSRRSSLENVGEVPGGVRPDEAALARAEKAHLLAALDALPEEWRTVLTLCDLEDVPHAEAARALGRSTAATKSLLYRARRALRDSLIENV